MADILDMYFFLKKMALNVLSSDKNSIKFHYSTRRLRKVKIHRV